MSNDFAYKYEYEYEYNCDNYEYGVVVCVRLHDVLKCCL
jgi:hypothetical protein